ncbi:hypothetical protein EGW08_006414 [Elysia chlorotica]|uniref:G-protein coupled receptors family 1 profile domain-containing protein n=1 Tax=Elysia chlorotica TaxID=188477 RepID=A0A433TW65_ELYCH|nr:hypothetical protein EGW08_006414 [Elysia chlorotica]
MDLNQSMEKNGTTLSPGPLDEAVLVQRFEDAYLRVRPGFSWTFVGTGCFGIVGNILIVAVFAKMGFSNTIHISYSALAVSDLFCVLASMVYGITVMDVVRNSFNAQTSYRMSNIFGGLPHVCFARTTALITAWISLERCLCVKFPTKVRLMITRTVTKIVLGTIFALGCIPMVFVYAANSSSKGTSGERATLLVPVWVTANHAVAVSQNQHKLAKENRVTKVVVILAVLFLLCSLPMSVNILADFIIPEYSIDGSLRYLHLINGMINVLVTELNSSVNVVVFAVSGHRFRSVLFEILSKGRCQSKIM